MTPRAEIESLIPHRAPMLLLDEIVTRDHRSIECLKRFGEAEFFFQGHYPGNPIVPGVILCEAGMQAGALLLATLAPLSTGTPLATRMDNVKFRRIVQPGQTLTVRAELVDQISTAYLMKATCSLEGRVAARLEFVCTLKREASGVTSEA